MMQNVIRSYRNLENHILKPEIEDALSYYLRR